MKTAWIFPGQGAQTARMGQKFLGRAVFETVLDTIDEVSGRPVRDFVLEMGEPELRRTDRAQLAIFAMSMGIAACLREEGLSPYIAAGHSLGHFSALTAVGALGLEEATLLVATRGQLMLYSGERRQGGMSVVQGLDAHAVETALRSAGVQVWLANLNLAEQIVVSGAAEDMDRTRLAIAEAGGKWIALNVSGAFHSPLLDNEARFFADKIADLDLRDPDCPVISNATGDLLDSAESIRADLVGHMTGQVCWCAVMDHIAALRPDQVIEIGPGKVLTGLFLRHAPEYRPLSTGLPTLLERAIQAHRPMIEERNVA